MTDLQLRQVRAGTRVRSRETARLGTVMQRWTDGARVTHINVQMDDGTAVELDTTGTDLASLDFIAGGFLHECSNCGAQSRFLVYTSLDVDTAQVSYICGLCDHSEMCRIVSIGNSVA